MNGVVGVGLLDDSEFVEVDPTGRYGRYNEVLGEGASKTVYRAFDEYEGIEVAWNQVKLNDFLQSPEDLERLYSEIHLLKTLKHRNIMKFYTSWVDTVNRNINFVTEMFTSGTLRQYRMKHKRVHIRAVKHWCRQTLKGLLYLHSRNPPIIHRDLKCDNIFINGNQGQVKIGDLGLAAILRKSHAARCVGTPEFMAPEVYAEEYNELVDIYAFGMCILEMVTCEYPYSECNYPAQIYKKVMSGKKPDSLYKVEDPEVRRFIEKCLASVSHRLSASELLEDPFLQIDGYVSESEYPHNNLASDNGYFNLFGYEEDNDLDFNHPEYEADELELFSSPDDDHLKNVDITIKGKRREDDGIFLRLRIADKEGRGRNIYFPFDIENDTALCVATEMVAELDINDQDVTTIADMIDGQIASLVPEWKTGLGMDGCHQEESNNNLFCHNCSSTDSVVDLMVPKCPVGQKMQLLECCRQKYGGMHGRFEEITYQFNGSEQNKKEDTLCGQPSQSPNIQYTDIWAQLDAPELISISSTGNFSGDEHENSYNLTDGNDDCARPIRKEGDNPRMARPYRSVSAAQAMVEDHENEIRRELRWLKAKYQLQRRELQDQQVRGEAPKPPQNPSPDHNNDQKGGKNATRKGQEQSKSLHLSENSLAFSPDNAAKKLGGIKILNIDMAYGSCSPEPMVTAKKFYTGTFLPSSLHRATSLPVDATEF